jgi:hypothetical protein
MVQGKLDATRRSQCSDHVKMAGLARGYVNRQRGADERERYWAVSGLNQVSGFWNPIFRGANKMTLKL